LETDSRTKRELVCDDPKELVCDSPKKLVCDAPKELVCDDPKELATGPKLFIPLCDTKIFGPVRTANRCETESHGEFSVA
jgi:hypothetical protein